MLQVLLWILAAVGALVLLYLAYMFVRTLMAGRGGRCPEGISAAVEAPARARVGEELSLVVRVTNSLDRPRTLTHTDLTDSFARGFEVVSVVPVPIMKSDFPKLGTWVYAHKQPLGPRETVTVTFALRAAKAGAFGGDVTIYVDDDHFSWLECPVGVEIME